MSADLDPHRGITVGERWEKTLHEAAGSYDAVLFLISTDWLASEWCFAKRATEIALQLPTATEAGKAKALAVLIAKTVEAPIDKGLNSLTYLPSASILSSIEPKFGMTLDRDLEQDP